MQSERFLKAREKAQPENRIFVSKNLALIEELYHVMDELGWTQKRLAQELGKSESEISKWTSGLHNFTFKTISKLEAVLGRDLLVTPKTYQQKYIASIELHVHRVTSQVRTQFVGQRELIAYETKVKVNCDGNPVVVKHDKKFAYEPVLGWANVSNVAKQGEDDGTIAA